MEITKTKAEAVPMTSDKWRKASIRKCGEDSSDGIIIGDQRRSPWFGMLETWTRLGSFPKEKQLYDDEFIARAPALICLLIHISRRSFPRPLKNWSETKYST